MLVVGDDDESAIPFVVGVDADAAGVSFFTFPAGLDTAPAFIHAYFPLLRPAACVATAFDSLFCTSSDMLRAVTPGPSFFFLAFFGAAPSAGAITSWRSSRER